MRKVVLLGSNLIISTIRASLQKRHDFEVIQIDALSQDTIEGLEAADPDVLVFDVAAAQRDFAIPLLRKRPGLLLVGVDVGGKKMLVLSGEQSRLLTSDDLMQVIEGARR